MFDLVFLLDPSSKSTSAQNESCSSSFPLQLLFWSNSEFLYEIWSFSGSNSSQNCQTKKQWFSCARHGVARQPYRRLWPAVSFHASAIAPWHHSSPRAGREASRPVLGEERRQGAIADAWRRSPATRRRYGVGAAQCRTLEKHSERI